MENNWQYFEKWLFVVYAIRDSTYDNSYLRKDVKLQIKCQFSSICDAHVKENELRVLPVFWSLCKSVFHKEMLDLG